MCRCPLRPKKDITSARAGIIGGCELSSMAAESRTRIFYNAVCSLDHQDVSLVPGPLSLNIRSLLI